MNESIRKAAGPALAWPLIVSWTAAQGTFQNLDFELARVPDLAPGQYGSLNGTPAADALPYWTTYYGDNQVTMVTHNNYTLGTVNISILGPNWSNSPAIMGGRYSVVLQTGMGFAKPYEGGGIAQAGLIPATARSIQIRVDPFGGSIPAVTFAGHDITLVTLTQHSMSDLVLGGDISAFAGQSGELRLASLNYPDFHFGSFVIDDIVFSPVAIPEPSVLTLLFCGGVVLSLAAWGRLR